MKSASTKEKACFFYSITTRNRKNVWLPLPTVYVVRSPPLVCLCPSVCLVVCLLASSRKQSIKGFSWNVQNVSDMIQRAITKIMAAFWIARWMQNFFYLFGLEVPVRIITKKIHLNGFWWHFCFGIGRTRCHSQLGKIVLLVFIWI